MTIQFPDISSYESGISLANMVAVLIKATEGTTYTNPDFSRAWSDAQSRELPAAAYHFLHHDSDPATQAQHFHDVAGDAPCMLDVETASNGTMATVADCLAFATKLRSLGGYVRLVYFPHWYWMKLGQPDLTPLAQAGMALISSNYTAYSDTGPGWASYGGMTPMIWQFTDAASLNGFTVDMNAYKGTAAQLAAYLNGTEDTEMGTTPADLAPGFALDENGTLINPDAVTVITTPGFSPFKTLDMATDWATVTVRVAAHTPSGWVIQESVTFGTKWFWQNLPPCDIIAVSRRKASADDNTGNHPVAITVTF